MKIVARGRAGMVCQNGIWQKMLSVDATTTVASKRRRIANDAGNAPSVNVLICNEKMLQLIANAMWMVVAMVAE